MKHEKIDALEVCKEFEDVLAPRLELSVLDRAVYSHLLRHSRFEGKSRLRFSILWLANNMGVRGKSVRTAVRRLTRPSTPAKAAFAFTVCGRSPAGPTAWITWCRKRRVGATPTAIWSPAAWTVTRKRAIARPKIFFANSTARAACRPRTSAHACSPCRRSRQASCGHKFSMVRMQKVSDLG